MANSLPDDEKLLRAVVRLNAKMLGLILGILFGLAIFIATNWLLIKGAYIDPNDKQVIGPHLQLLDQFFIGYRVSFLGSIIGFLYGFAIGTFCGALIGWVYNKIIDLRRNSFGL
jgi:ABC-type nitrate/sulfonate/bicarbonate transport system permease component